MILKNLKDNWDIVLLISMIVIIIAVFIGQKVRQNNRDWERGYREVTLGPNESSHGKPQIDTDGLRIVYLSS